MLVQRLAIIGVGLIGGSLARALRAAGEVGEVVGCGRGKENLERAVELGVIDSYTHDVGEAVAGADMIFLAVPLGAMRDTFAAMKGRIMDGAVITDGGSAKGSVVDDCRAVFGADLSAFVPGHPIAGTENSGVESSYAELYRNRRVILTPSENTSDAALQRVRAMWEACGSAVTIMSIQHHDEVLAATSHLPHMLAFALVDSLARMKENDDIFRYAAGGFRDFTRIASSSPVMWRDICIANRQALSSIMKSYSKDMADLADTISQGDGERLLQIFERAKRSRDRYIDGTLDSSE